MYGKIIVFATTASQPLGVAICEKLSIPLGQARVRTFSDGEIDIQLEENVRDADVFIISETSPPADKVFEACFLSRAARSSSARRITMIIPYLGYDRQDRKDRPRTQISAEFMAQVLKLGYPDRFLFLDVHSEPTLGYFNPLVFDHLYGSIDAVDYLKKKLADVPPNEIVVASPDKGGGPRAEAYAKRLGLTDYVLFTKSRPEPNQVAEASVKIIGDVKDKSIIFVDDIIDTANTIVADAKAAHQEGAKDIYVFATHGLFSDQALERLEASQIKEVIVTDTISHEPYRLATKRIKITVLSIAPLLATAIRHLNQGEGLSSLIK